MGLMKADLAVSGKGFARVLTRSEADFAAGTPHLCGRGAGEAEIGRFGPKTSVLAGKSMSSRPGMRSFLPNMTSFWPGMRSFSARLCKLLAGLCKVSANLCKGWGGMTSLAGWVRSARRRLTSGGGGMRSGRAGLCQGGRRLCKGLAEMRSFPPLWGCPSRAAIERWLQLELR
jgi:hypothetical protein